MQIDWFTVIAQVLNFLLLVWLLKRLLYKPVLKAIDEREKRIATELKEAEATKAEALKEQGEYLARNEKFDQRKRELMEEANREAKETREKLLAEVRQEAEHLRATKEAAWTEMQTNRELELQKKTQEEVFAMTEKVLNDLASHSLEEQVVATFITEITDLKKEEKKALREALRPDARLPHSKRQPIQVRSAFELPPKLKGSIHTAVSEVVGSKMPLEFSTTPELISGIELTANGYKLAWSIADYLRSLKQAIAEGGQQTTTRRKT